MDPLITPASQQYAISAALVEKNLADFSDADARQSPAGDSNSILWLVGHLANTRCRLLEMLGVDRAPRWPEFFSRGANPADRDKHPALDEVLSEWRDVSASLSKRLEEIGDAELSAKCPRDFPIADKTMRGAITFLAYHEGYHVGQMAYLRKLFGKGQLVG